MQLSVNTAADHGTAGFDPEAFLQDHRGGITVEEGLALARHASMVDYGHSVEIGSFRGKSASALAHGLCENAAATGKVGGYRRELSAQDIAWLESVFGEYRKVAGLS